MISMSAFNDCVNYVWEIKWKDGRTALYKKYKEKYVEEEFPWFRGESDIDYDLIPELYRESAYKNKNEIPTDKQIYK